MQYMRAYRDIDAGGDLVFTASTPGVKSDGLSIDQDRWDLGNYSRNPVFLWAHDYGSLPLGAAEAWVEDGVLRAKVTRWAQTSIAGDVRQAYDDGILNAVSVGWEDVDEDGAPIKRGQTAAKHVLLDISAVPVPGDPDALVERQKRAWSALGQELIRMATTDTAEDVVVEGDGTGETLPQIDGDGERVAEPVDEAPEPEAQDEPEHTGTERGEDAWGETAAAMVAVFARESDEADDERQDAYRALLPKYRRHGVEPPEFLTRAELDATDEPEWRAVFLAGELDALGIVEGQRVGAVLNSRNMQRIADARDLLTEVIDSATPKDKATDERTAEPIEQPDDEPNDPLALLRSMRDTLTEAHDG